MTSDPPVSFDAAKKTAGNPSSGGYPYQLKADDLDKNFVWATLEIHASFVEQTTGQGGHPQRKLKLPPAPTTGTHVLGAVNGALSWIATEEC